MDGSQVARQVAGLAVAGAVTAAASACFSLWYARGYSLVNDKTGLPASGPVPFPLLGNVISLTAEFYRTLALHAGCVDDPTDESGTDLTPPVFWVGAKPFVLINSVAGVRRVLGGGQSGVYAKPKYFGYRSRAIRSAVATQKGVAAVTSAVYDPDADSSRTALKALIDGAFPSIQKSGERILERLSEPGHDPLTVVSQEIVDLNLQILFGLRDRSIAEKTAAQINFAGEEFARRTVNPFRWMFHWVLTLKFYQDVYGLISLGRRLCRQLDEELSKGCGTWVHAWIGKVGAIGKLGKVVGLLMASTQTVPLTALWVLYLISSDPEVLEKARSELNEATSGSGSPGLTLEVMDNLPFCDAIIKEALRLFPPFPLLQREAQDDDVIDGLRIPRGTIVYIAPWVIHHHPGIWKNPSKFVPERFVESPSHGDAESDYAYIPFGRGTRMCAGYRLATLELKYLVALSILDYDIDMIFPEGAELTRFPDVSMKPHGISVTVHKRHPEQ